MFSLRRVLMIFAGVAAASLSATAASACAGLYGYGCGAGYYGYGWGARTGYGFGYGYGYAFPAPAYRYAAPTTSYYPLGGYFEPPVVYLDPSDAYPPRYFVNQGPVYGGPNVVNFAPGFYNPGYVRTRAYPYVGGYRTYPYVGGYRGAYMRPAYAAPRVYHRGGVYRRGVVYRPYTYRAPRYVAPRRAARVYVNQTPRGWQPHRAPAQSR